MMIFRLIIFVAVISLLVVAYRKLTAPGKKPSAPTDAATMKKCEHCGVHLPESEACREGDKYFCSAEHRKAYLEHHDSSE
ncbi:MAG: PP0621 family protein [Pseudomonadota bacterium]|nr:PP0621 family protein [Pseudomonadota bacterium]